MRKRPAKGRDETFTEHDHAIVNRMVNSFLLVPDRAPATTATVAGHEHPLALEPAGPEVLAPLLVAGMAGAAALGYLAHKLRASRRPPQDPAAAKEAPALDENPVVVRTISHPARGLVLDDLFATAEVETGHDVIDVTITGKQSRIAALSITPGEHTLSISNREQGHKQRMSILNALLPKWVLRQLGRITDLDVLDETNRLTINAKVPNGTDLTLKGIMGAIHAPGDYGNLELDTGYSQETRIGSVKNASVQASAASAVNIGSVHGSGRIDADYSTRVTIETGEIAPLNCTAGINTRVAIAANVHDAKVNTEYASIVRMGHADGAVELVAGINSEIEIGSGSATSVTIETDYSSGIAYDGITETAHANLGINSWTRIGRVTKFLRLKSDYSSQAKVMGGDIEAVDIECSTSSGLIAGGRIVSGIISLEYDSAVSAASYGPDVTVNKDGYSRLIATKETRDA